MECPGDEMTANKIKLVFDPKSQCMRAYHDWNWSARKPFGTHDPKAILEGHISASDFARVKKILKLMCEMESGGWIVDLLARLVFGIKD